MSPLFCMFVKLSLNDIFWPFYCTIAYLYIRQANRLRFSQLVALGEALLLLGLRAVRNLDDCGLYYPQIGHIGTNRPEKIIQTDFNQYLSNLSIKLSEMLVTRWLLWHSDFIKFNLGIAERSWALLIRRFTRPDSLFYQRTNHVDTAAITDYTADAWCGCCSLCLVDSRVTCHVHM